MPSIVKTFKIPYGIKDFKRIREEGYYYVDKTAYIRRMEARDSFVFLVRPRRMGKSLFVETLRCYYDIREKANFRKLFGGLDIGERLDLFLMRYPDVYDATDAEMAAKVEEAKAQLAKYRADRTVPRAGHGAPSDRLRLPGGEPAYARRDRLRTDAVKRRDFNATVVRIQPVHHAAAPAPRTARSIRQAPVSSSHTSFQVPVFLDRV